MSSSPSAVYTLFTLKMAIVPKKRLQVKLG